ncbi:MAG: valine--tRNA ligase [Bacteroidales bacterium]|nr:valine--tRNA ligase [Bacteroidales bacterium]
MTEAESTNRTGDTRYIAKNVEQKWYDKWIEKNLFHSEPDDREPYTIVIPPPNVTGVLHMGHMLNETIQDVLCRKERMNGKNVCWVPGTDHASIATEAKVVNLLKEKGINKSDLTREEFLKYAWQWKEEKGGIILQQLRKLGCCCDWERTKFTMDDDMSEAVTDVFCRLYEKGLIYRGVRMVNWDPKALTAVSDEEVVYKEQHSKLYYLRYYLEDEDKYIVVATTRPETIMGDTAVCVNPDDERFTYLKGKKVIVPHVGRVVPVIFDEYVDMTFGTGALKITPCHDINDYNIGNKHKLDAINIFNDNGTLNENGMQYKGMDRFDCRKAIVKDLEAEGLIEKIEDYDNKIGLSERTSVPIEPKLSMQWFCRMKELAEPALEVVENNVIQFWPDKFKNTYRHWMENVKDWCISRQLWWGHRIPAYYLPNKEIVVGRTLEEAYNKAKKLYPAENYTIEDLKQDEDVLDTWFSSWLWPMSCFDGIRNPKNKEIEYYYPTNDLITAPDIMFFWVARMIMSGLEYRDEIPFKNVYFTGTVRDKLGRKMSKSLGNSPDPLVLIDKYGADGVRMGMLMVSPAGGDLLFDDVYCEQGRNFSNKIWNALRLVKGFNVERIPQPEHSKLAIAWFRQRMNVMIESINDDFSKYRLSESLKNIYSFIWDDFCSWLLEIVKPEYQKPIDSQTYEQVIDIFEDLMKILHPFMPFVTEEIYHNLRERNEDDFIMNASYPTCTSNENIMDEEFVFIKEIITAIRSLRNSKGISPKQVLQCFVKISDSKDLIAKYESIIIKTANVDKIQFVEDKQEGTLSLMIRTTEIFIPIAQNVNKDEEIKKINEQIKYYEGFKMSVSKKLANEKFVSNAPANVVELERKKLADCESKLTALKQELESLK